MHLLSKIIDGDIVKVQVQVNESLAFVTTFTLLFEISA